MSFSSFLHLFGRPKTYRRPQASAKPRKTKLVLEALEHRELLSSTVISGFVYNDANNNGIFDSGEQAIANSQLQLKNAAGTVIGTATNNAQGFYQFTTDQTVGTAPATQTIHVSFGATKTDWTQSQPLAQFNPDLGTLTSVDIINNATLTSHIKVESLGGAPSTIVGTVSGAETLSGPGFSPLEIDNTATETFQASAFDGTIDFAGTSGHDFGDKTATGSRSISISNATDLAQYTGTGTVNLSESAHATSMATGDGNLISQVNSTAGSDVTVVYHYIPNNSIRPGHFTIVQSSQPSGFLEGLESKNGVPIPQSVGTDVISVDLAASSSANNNFAEIQPASVSGVVYLDLNNNGIKDAGERGLAGIAIHLTGLDDLGHSVTGQTTTTGDGSYAFTGLRPGTSTFSEVGSDGFLTGKDTLGSLGGSVVGADQLSVALKPNDAGVNYDFGEQPAPVAAEPVTPITPISPISQPFSKRMFLASTFRQF